MKLQYQTALCLSICALLAAGCVPDPLEGFDDTGVTSNNPNSMIGDTGGTNNAMDMGGAGSFNPQFLQVTAILRPNCLLGGCHGNPAGAAQVFLVPTGQNATDAEIQTALSTMTPTGSTGYRLIAPGNPGMSEIYLRVTKPAGDPQLMGAGTYGGLATPLMQAEIDTINAWIMAGATYTQ